ncbi:esterase/lipase family protein (plasmid) [Coraliomargarita sp. W4R53]
MTLPPDADRIEMPRSSVIAKARWWAADYVYALRRQLAILTPPWTLGRRRPTPRAWRTGNAALPEVILVPGVYEHWTFLRPLGDSLAAAGHRVRVVHGVGINRRPIPATAAYLGKQLAKDAAPEAGRVLVAHSKGGLIGKHLLVSSGAAHSAAAEAIAGGSPAEAAAEAGQSRPLGLIGMVAICAPFHGVRLARLFADPSIRAFLPNDETIVALGSDTSVNGRIVSVFGPFDPHIPEGSALEGARNVLVSAPGHFRVLQPPATHEAVIEGIAHLAQH